MRKYFYSFLLLALVFITCIAYLGNINRTQLTSLTIQRLASIHTVQQEPCNKKINFNFMQRYPKVRECNIESLLVKSYEQDSEYNSSMANSDNFDYSKPAANETHQLRIVKGVLFYFPIELRNEFMYEFRWLYRSWIEMQKHEPVMWRTDLIVFVKNDRNFFDDLSFFFNQLNCSFAHRRKSSSDLPMCTLIEYTPLKSRPITRNDNYADNSQQRYEHILTKIDIFSDDEKNLNPFYSLLKEKLSNYGYLDSILMAFDGYSYLKSAGYNFLVRSDMDVFLTPLFAKWLPRHCNDFYVGRGGFSSTFNVKRLGRIAKDLGFEYASQMNLGSTWYSTPEQFRLVSYLTLFGMAYVSEEEFSQPEREGRLGVQLWPHWHYGVLLLYGQSLVMNHLIQTKQLNIVKLHNYLDYPSHYNENINKIIHIHVFHGKF